MYNTYCEQCGQSFEAERVRFPAFCSDKCRVKHHRQQGNRAKRAKAIERLGFETGLAFIIDHEDGEPASKRFKYLSSRALYLALTDLGFEWTEKAGEWQRRNNQLL